MAYFPLATLMILQGTSAYQRTQGPGIVGNSRDTWNLPYPPLQVSVISSHNIDLMFLHAIYQAVVGVYALMVAFQPLPAFISCNS